MLRSGPFENDLFPPLSHWTDKKQLEATGCAGEMTKNKTNFEIEVVIFFAVSLILIFLKKVEQK